MGYEKGLVLLSCLLQLALSASCPDGCLCSLDLGGRRRLACLQGGLRGSLPITGIDPSTEVIEIQGTVDKENSLTIGPLFQGLWNLSEVRVTHSNVPAIGRHTFWGVPSLLILDLSHNNITQVVDNNFRGLVRLRELLLDWNSIESMSSGTFQYLPELRRLSLAGNRLTSLAPRLFLKLGQLTQLDLSYNSLDSLDPQVFKDVQEVRQFSCRGCEMSTMNPHMYSLLPSLSQLDLGENQFKYLDREAFLDLRNLRGLRLDGNHFPVVMGGTFQSQAKLESLDLARSEIAKVTLRAFENLTSLTELDLSYNKLERLEPGVLEPVGQSLRQLRISGNNFRVEDLTFVLQVTPKLRKLELADLNMEEGIPLGLLASVVSLKHLNLSGSRLTRFPVELLYPVTSLSLLDLSRNLLHSLDERAVSRLGYVGSVRLAGNPLTCDLCHIPPLLEADWSRRSAAGLVCSEPPHLRGRTLEELKIAELAACDYVLDMKRTSFLFSWDVGRGHLLLLCTAAGLSALLLGLLGGLAYSRVRHRSASYSTQRMERKDMAKRTKKTTTKTKKKKNVQQGRYWTKSTVACIDGLTNRSFELAPLTILDKPVLVQ